MSTEDSVWAIGLMSGTSLDGVDAALIRTDGTRVYEFGPWLTQPFEDETRLRIREVVLGRGDRLLVEQEITLLHLQAIKELMRVAGFTYKDVRVIGFHGQTLDHRPEKGVTCQIGDGALLAEKTRIDVVCDFRRRDMAAGGVGAPLVPLYHAALAIKVDLPVAILNLGGIGNVTWIGRSEGDPFDLLSYDIIAFDTGPGNVLLNEWAYQTIQKPCDEDGRLARAGKVDMGVVETLLADPYFNQHPPKSLDRNYFNLDPVAHLSPEDGAATLTEFTAAAVQNAERYFPAKPHAWYGCGGGVHNPAIMQALSKRLGNVDSVVRLGWNPDALEAQAFAFLAVRSLKGQAISLPTTTGANRAVTGGAFYRA